MRYEVAGGCTFCMTCVNECPVEAIRMTPDGAVIDQAACVGCGVCQENCPSEAIEVIDEKEEHDG